MATILSMILQTFSKPHPRENIPNITPPSCIFLF